MLKHALRYFKNLESGKEKRCQNWELCTNPILLQLHSADPALPPSPSTLSIISMGRELILQQVGKRDSVHTWVVPVHVRENTGTWIKKLSKAINYWEACVWEDRTMQESPSTKHIVINHWCFFCVLVIMIRSCLAKEDNKGVHKGTGCLASSQLNLSWPALPAWAQEHTLPLQHNAPLGTLCPSAAEHFIPVLPSSSQRIELSLISHPSSCECISLCARKS